MSQNNNTPSSQSSLSIEYPNTLFAVGKHFHTVIEQCGVHKYNNITIGRSNGIICPRWLSTKSIELLNLPPGVEFRLLLSGKYLTTPSVNGVLDMANVSAHDTVYEPNDDNAFPVEKLHEMFSTRLDQHLAGVDKKNGTAKYKNTLNLSKADSIEIVFPEMNAPATIPELTIVCRYYNIFMEMIDASGKSMIEPTYMFTVTPPKTAPSADDK
jgi:hypothetical protein